MRAAPSLALAVVAALALPAPAQDRPAGVRRMPRGAEAEAAELDGAQFRIAVQEQFAGLRVAQAEQPPWSVDRLAGVQPDPRVRAWVADLGSEEPARREAATTALLDQSLPDEQVWLQLARPPEPLGAEAHARLIEVCRSRIIDAPRGALGIQMAGRFGDENGVTVTALIPNMPARKVLRAGDRIVALDGRPVRNSNELSGIVQVKRPGQRIKVTVMRGERDELGRVRGGPDGKPVETRLELEMDVGSRSDLERFGDQGLDFARPVDTRERLVQQLVSSFPGPVRRVDPSWLQGEPMEVDSHPAVAQLRESLARADALPQVALWKAQVEHLRGLARSPSLSDPERAYFNAVADRMEQLIAEGAAADSPGAER